MSSPIRPTTSGASQAPTGFEDLLPAAAAPRPTTSSAAAAAPTGFEDLVPQAPAAPSTAAVLRAGAKALRQNMRSAAGWERIGKGAYHGVVDPLATTSVFIGGSPEEIERAVAHSSAQETTPTDPWYRPQVATTPDAQEGALEGTAVAALPVGELAGAALGKLAPGTFGALAARLAASRAGRATLAGASGAAHGAAIGAASQPGQRAAGAVVGGVAGGVAGAATQPIAEAVGDVVRPAVDRAKGRVKSAIGDYLLNKQEAALNARRTGTNYYPEMRPTRLLADEAGQAPPAPEPKVSATVDAQQGPELPDYAVEQNPGPGTPAAAHDGAHVQVERDSPTTLAVRARGHDVETSGVVPLPTTDADVDGLVQHIVGQYAPAVARGRWSWADLATLEGRVRGAIVAASHSDAPAMPARQGPQRDPNAPRAPEQGPKPAPVAPVRLGPYPDLPAEDLAGHLGDALAMRTEQRDVALRDAQTDELTGLANQGAFARALPNAEAHPGTRIVRFDLNGMKAVNDGLGHPAGNAVLQTAAQAMVHGAAAAGIHARIFRVGGDEFAALVPATHADAFRSAVEQTYGVQDHAPGIRTSLSGGIGNTDTEADADTYARKAVQKAAHGIPERAPVSVVAPAPVAAPAAAPAPVAPTVAGPGTAVARPRRVNWNPKAWRARYGAQLEQLSDAQLEEARGHLEAARAKAAPGSTADELLHRDLLNVANEQDGRARARGAEPDMKPETRFEQSLLTMERPQLEAELERHERALEAGLTTEDTRTANRVVTLARRRLAELDRAPAALPAAPSATSVRLDETIPGEEDWAKFDGKVRHKGATVTIHSHGPYLSLEAGGLDVFGGSGGLWPTDTDGLHQQIARILKTYANSPTATVQLSKTGTASAELDALHRKIFDLVAPHAPDPALIAGERARHATLNAEADARHAPDETQDETPAGFEDLLPPTAAKTPAAEPSAPSAELEREHAELFAELEQLHRDRKKPGANYIAEREPLVVRLRQLRGELAAHGVTVPDVRTIGAKAKAPPRTAAQKKDLHKKPTRPETALAQAARYETTDRLRPLHTVATTALIDEIAALRDRIAERGGQTLYTPVENDRGEQIVVAHRKGGKGVSSQAKAMQNIADWQRNIDEIQQHLVATRDLSLEEVDELENQAHLARYDAAERGRPETSGSHALEEEDDGDPLPFETSPRYGVHGQAEPLSSSYVVPEHRRRPLPDAPLTKTVATTTYPQPGGEPVRVHHGTSVPHGDVDPNEQDPEALFGRAAAGYYTEAAAVAGGRPPHATSYGYTFATRAEAEAAREKHKAMRDTAEHVEAEIRPADPPSTGWELIETVTVPARPGYAHKGMRDQAHLDREAAGAKAELEQWNAGTAPLQQKFAELDREGAWTPAEREEELRALEQMHRDVSNAEVSARRRAHYANQGKAPNVRVARLDIRKPFDADRLIDDDPGAFERILKAARELYPAFDWDESEEQLEQKEQFENLTGEDVYRALQHTPDDESGQKFGPTRVNELLEHLGYDAITHIGGGRSGGVAHRVWIPFHRQSVFSAFGPAEDAYIVSEPAPSYEGAHYRAQLAERARRLTPEQTEQLTLTFGSPEKGLAMAAKVAADAGDFADVTYITPTRANLTSGARARNVALARSRQDVLTAQVSIIGKRIDSLEKVAQLARPFRDPSAEHFVALLTDEQGTVLDYMHITSGAINYVQTPRGFAEMIDSRARAVGATRVWAVHNHPSGDPTPSGQGGDTGFTVHLRELLQRVALHANTYRPEIVLEHHIVLNHDTYAVISVLDDNGQVGISHHQLEQAPTDGDWTAHKKGLKLFRAPDAARLVAGVLGDDDGFHVLYLDNQHNGVAATAHTSAAIPTMGRWLNRELDAHGAGFVVLATRSTATAKAILKMMDEHRTEQRAVFQNNESALQRPTWETLAAVLDVVTVMPDGTVADAVDLMGGLPELRRSHDMRDATHLREWPRAQLGMFGAEPPPKPSKQDQLGMFSALEGTKLAQDEATKLANKDAKISPDELAQRRDELGAPKAAEIPTGPDQGALFEHAPRYGAGGRPTAADALLREHPAEYGRELRDSFRRAFNPLARGELATQAGHVIRARTGEHAREIEVITDAAKAASRYFARLPKEEQLAFIDRMETGEPQPTPELQRFADAFRQGLDSARAAVQALGTGKLRDWIDNYFPHIWKDPKKAGIFFGRRPLEGSKSFLKKRSVPTIKDGIAAGLEPVTTNPADLTVLKLREMHKYILAWRIINELRALGLARWISVRRKPAENWTMIDDRVATKYGPPTVTVAHAEAFDAELRRQLAKVLEALGVQHDRTLTDRHAGPGTWGYAESTGRRIWSKFGGDVTVLIHELGHVLDDRFGLWNYLVATPKSKLNAKGKSVSADSPEEIAARKTINAELRALADARYGEATTDTYKKYVRKRPEKIANAIHAVLYAPELAQRLAPTVTARLRAFLSSHAETRPLLALERSVQLGTAARTKDYDTGGVVILAKLYAPDEVARVVNNYLSPGLRGSPYYNAYMGIGNLLNAAQLGLSLFHLGFTSLDAAVSKFALGLEQAIAGQPINAFRSIALSPVAPLTNAIRGDKVLREYLKPGSVGGEFFEIANAVAAAGGRVRMDEWYRVGQWKAMRQAMVETIRGADWTARGKGAMEAAVRVLPAALELAAKPLMEYIVPRQKLGVFADLARLELDKLARKYPDGAPPDVVRAALQRAWNSVDNRMGQMVYDNLFWHKVGKDLAHAAMRSVGWNIGTLREVGGGLTDTGRAALDGGRALRGMFGGGSGGNGGGKGPGAGGAADDRAPGRGPQRGPTDAPYFTHRMAYIVALPMFVGLAGALLQYLYTGEGPDSIKDLYYPRTGRKTPEGDDERLTLPSYMKDVFAARRHPAETVLHKASPLIDLIGAMLENKDYYGTQIHNPDDNTWRQLEQSLAYVGKSFLPFSLQGALEETKRGGSRVSRALPMVGITPAPKEVTRTAAQQAAFEIAQRRRQGIRTPEESELGQQKSDLVRRARAGEAIGPELQQLVQAGEITVADAKRILKARLTSAETRRFQSLTVEQARAVLQQATPEERAALGPLMARKIRSAAQRHALPVGARGQEPPHDP